MRRVFPDHVGVRGVGNLRISAYRSYAGSCSRSTEWALSGHSRHAARLLILPGLELRGPGRAFRKLIIERVKVRGQKRTARTTPPSTSGRRRRRGKPNQPRGTRATANVL